MNWNELRDRAYQNSVKHGFHQGGESVRHYLCLVITELAEAVDAYRKSHMAMMGMFLNNCCRPQPKDLQKRYWNFVFEKCIKDSVQDELADSVIRLLDLSGMLDIDLNVRVPNLVKLRKDCAKYEDRKSMSFTEEIWEIMLGLTGKGDPLNAIPCAIADIALLCQAHSYNLIEHIKIKMEYNENRPIRHGKQY